MTGWTDTRLTRLFERYRSMYWPRSRRLRSFRIENSELERCLGYCYLSDRLIRVDVKQHGSDRGVRATVLHEMVHAVVGRPGHGAPFWEQLEYLLSRRAPVTVGFPELGELRTAPKRHP